MTPRLCDVVQGLALPDDDLVDRLGIDVRGLFPLNSHNWKIDTDDAGEYWGYHRRVGHDAAPAQGRRAVLLRREIAARSADLTRR